MLLSIFCDVHQTFFSSCFISLINQYGALMIIEVFFIILFASHSSPMSHDITLQGNLP